MWGCPVAAVITVQSAAGLVRSHALDAGLVAEQIEEALAHHPATVMKTGALGSSANVRAIRATLARRPRLLSVVDPVLVPTRGTSARLLDRGALSGMTSLCEQATVVTPNAAEASALTGIRVRDVDSMARAAEDLVQRGARAALVKGGHVAGDRAVDVFATRAGVVRLSGPRHAVGEVHGTGCTLASLVAGRLATSENADEDALVEAARWSKRVLGRALARALRIGDGMRVVAPR